MKSGTEKDREKWSATSFSCEHPGVPTLCPFSLLHRPTAVWSGETSVSWWVRVATRRRRVTTLPCILWSCLEQVGYSHKRWPCDNITTKELRTKPFSLWSATGSGLSSSLGCLNIRLSHPQKEDPTKDLISENFLRQRRWSKDCSFCI